MLQLCMNYSLNQVKNKRSHKWMAWSKLQLLPVQFQDQWFVMNQPERWHTPSLCAQLCLSAQRKVSNMGCLALVSINIAVIYIFMSVCVCVCFYICGRVWWEHKLLCSTLLHYCTIFLFVTCQGSTPYLKGAKVRISLCYNMVQHIGFWHLRLSSALSVI